MVCGYSRLVLRHHLKDSKPNRNAASERLAAAAKAANLYDPIALAVGGRARPSKLSGGYTCTICTRNAVFLYLISGCSSADRLVSPGYREANASLIKYKTTTGQYTRDAIASS
eukprot:1059169-Rhodomonas_salina.4